MARSLGDKIADLLEYFFYSFPEFFSTLINKRLKMYVVHVFDNDEAISNAVAATFDLDELNKRDKLLIQRKISKHGFDLKTMKKNLEFLFFAGFMRSIKSIKHTFPNLSGALNYTIRGESGYGYQLANALKTMHRLPSTKLRNLLPDSIADLQLNLSTARLKTCMRT